MRLIFILPFAVFSLLATAQNPLNDDCSTLIDLGEVPYCSQPAQFTNVNATTSNIDPVANVPACWNNLGDRDVWFQFNLPANGSIVDVSISVWGNIAGNGTLKMPQLAVYRGDCEFGGLAELDCIVAPLNVNELHLDLFGLTPGVPYFLRINDFSANASPNWGTFKLCVDKYQPDVNIGSVPGTASCSGTLWDSGGPDGDYQSNENATFVICPSEFHQCIKLNFIQYATEFDYDFIRIYEGNGTNGNLIQSIDGNGINLEIQVPSNCVTIEFDSDGSIEDAGFQMAWLCSSDVCDAPPPTLPSNATCDEAISINGCANTPQFIPLSPGMGDPNFIQDGVNQGCILFPSDEFNFSFFYFQAQADGKFGFSVQSANPNEASDIDFNVWGPIPSVDEICNFVSSNQPIRSSWDEGADLTGLADIHPVTGTPVNDNFDCGSPLTPGTDPPFGTADDFVRRIDVTTGQIYVVMLDDYDGNIEMNGIAIDFSGTTDGVLGLPDSPITVSNDTFSCNGAPVQLQVTGGVSFAWSPSAGLSCNDCPNPFANPTETTTYEVQVVDVCQSLTETVTVSVGPTVNVQNDTTICNGESVLLGHTAPQAGVTYTWSPNDGSLDDPASPNPTATPMQTTVYTLTASNGVCTVTRVVTIAVVNLDLQLNVATDTAICRGQSLSIQASVNPSNVPINWSPLTQLQVQPGGMSAIASPNSNITYTVMASLSGCVRKETVSIQVDSLPANLSIFPSDTTICGGEEVLLVSPSYSGTNFPNLQFVWQTTAGQTFPDEDELYFLAAPLETTTYQRITTNGACVHTATATVHVAVVPVLNITPGSPQLCLGESVQLMVGNAVGLTNPQWSPPVGLSCITCTNPVAAPSSSMTYQFSGTVANGCSASATVFVEVNQQPQYQFPQDTLCAGESITLNLIADSTVTYSWTSNPPGFVSSAAQPMATPAQTTTYFVTLENGCTVQEQFTISVIPAGNLSINAPDTICAGAVAQLTASGSYPGTFVWNTGATGQVLNVSPLQTSTYTVTYSYPLPMPQCQLVDSVVVDVQGAVAQVMFPTDTQLCPGEGVMLNSVETPGGTYIWESTPPIFSSNEAIPPIFYPEESAIYKVTTTLGNCTVTHKLQVTVFNPQMVVSEDMTVCAGETVTISADAFLTGDYEWTPGGTDPTFEVVATASSQYFLRFEYGEGCVYEDTVKVTVVPNFTLKLVTDPDTNRINAGDPIFLDAFVPGMNVSGFSFEWLENNSNLVGSSQQITVTPVTTDSTISYEVTVVSPSGCIQTASVEFIIVQPNIKVPNAFTPNGDGANDSFGLAIVEGVAIIEKMEIYSRWGQRVFSSSDPNARWDGAIDGKPAPSDVYAFVIFWRGGDGALRYESGEVTLLR